MKPLVPVLALISSSLVGCVTQQQVQADIWMNDSIPASVCAKDPQLQRYGMYRVVACSSKPTVAPCQHGEKQFEEYRSYCSTQTKNYLSMLNSDAEKWLSQLTIPKSQ